jgi:hypothetical protein
VAALAELLPVNEKETKAKAQSILSKYRTERGYARMPINPRITASWSNDPVSTVGRDPYALERIQRKESGEEYIKFIDQAISALPSQEHRWLLRSRYCSGSDSKHPDADAIDRLNNMDSLHYSISTTKYFSLRDEALMAVAFYLGCVVKTRRDFVVK